MITVFYNTLVLFKHKPRRLKNNYNQSVTTVFAYPGMTIKSTLVNQLEREWRQKALLEAAEKAKREALVSEERRRQVEARAEARLAAALAHKEELLKNPEHSIIPEQRLKEEHYNTIKVK